MGQTEHSLYCGKWWPDKTVMALGKKLAVLERRPTLRFACFLVQDALLNQQHALSILSTIDQVPAAAAC